MTSPELKISSIVLRYGIIRIRVFTALHSKDDKVKIHCSVWLQDCNLYSSNIAGHNANATNVKIILRLKLLRTKLLIRKKFSHMKFQTHITR